MSCYILSKRFRECFWEEEDSVRKMCREEENEHAYGIYNRSSNKKIIIYRQPYIDERRSKVRNYSTREDSFESDSFSSTQPSQTMTRTIFMHAPSHKVMPDEDISTYASLPLRSSVRKPIRWVKMRPYVEQKRNKNDFFD